MQYIFLLLLTITMTKGISPGQSQTEPYQNGLTILWEPGQTIWIRFVGGDADQRSQVRKYAREWTYHANLKFVFRQSGYAHIRISFDPYGGHWSKYGRFSTLEKFEPSMNIGLNKNNNEKEWRRVVLHEFGHALGLMHEHQIDCPSNPIQFSSPAELFAYYRRTQGWGREKTKANLLRKKTAICSMFDPESIMMYAIPNEIRKDKLHLIQNTRLSSGDRFFISILYP